MKDKAAKAMRTIGSLTLCRSLLKAGCVQLFPGVFGIWSGTWPACDRTVVRASAPWLQRPGIWQTGRAGRPSAFRDVLGDVRVRRRYAGQPFVIQLVARRAGCLGA